MSIEDLNKLVPPKPSNIHDFKLVHFNHPTVFSSEISVPYYSLSGADFVENLFGDLQSKDINAKVRF